jgi:LPS-assembly lipoprotein
MWWSRAIALLLAAALLGGCGFQPLYKRDAARRTVPEMGAIRIDAAEDRLTQLVRNQLLDSLTPQGSPAAPLYRLTLHALERQSGVLVTRSDTTTRYNLLVVGSYELRDARSGDMLLNGQASSFAAYNVLRAEYTNLVAERDARERAARDIGEQIHLQIALFFDRRAAAKP